MVGAEGRDAWIRIPSYDRLFVSPHSQTPSCLPEQFTTIKNVLVKEDIMAKQ